MNATWRFVSLLTTILNRLIVLGLSGAVIFELVQEPAPGSTDVLTRATQLILSEPVIAITVAVILIVLNLNLVQFSLYSLANSPSRSFITSQTQGGRSRVALSAIQRALQATATQVAEIAKARIRVTRVGRKRYRVHARYRVRDVFAAGTAAEHLRLVLKKRFSELVVLDPSDRVEFDLDLAGIKRLDGAALNPPKKLPPPPDVEATETFKGPVYPVGEESTA